MKMCLAVAPAALLAACTFPALAQPTATVTITANGQSAVTVEPGEPVAINMRITYAGGVTLALIQGDARLAPSAGAGSAFEFHLGTGPLIASTGAFVGGSRLGIDAMQGPMVFFEWPDPRWTFQPVNVLSYQVTFAPEEAGTYSIAWQGSASNPNIRVYTSAISAIQTPAQTTSIPATITVTPAPASLALLALAPLATRRRR